ncbi:MAG: YqgE/AlgH family protein [Acidimicrobiales bacterium]
MTNQLRGCLLVATTNMNDPNFDRTVVFVIEHSPEGAVGVVLNRPLDLPVSEALPEWADAASEPAVLFSGGPVGHENALALQAHGEDDQFIIPGVTMADLAEPPADPYQSIVRIYSGYSGWDGGQLEGELAVGAWWVFDAVPDDIFATDPDEVWPAVLRRQGGDFRILADYPRAPWLN